MQCSSCSPCIDQLYLDRDRCLDATLQQTLHGTSTAPQSFALSDTSDHARRCVEQMPICNGFTDCKGGLAKRHHRTHSRPLDIQTSRMRLRKLNAELWRSGAGHKQQLQWFRSYIAAVLSTPSQQGSAPTHLLQVFDLRNKLIATSVPLTEVCSPEGFCLSLFMYACVQ